MATKKDAKKVDAPVEVKTDAKAAEPKEKKPVIEIIRGRMPLPIVHMIKFGTEGETDGAIAAKYRTTNGKVSDVRKDRNFGYVKEDYKPSKDMIEKAKIYADQLDDKSVIKAVNALKPADEAQQAAFDEARKASRPGRKKKEETPTEPATEAVVEPSDDELAGLTE